jgi:hypothetical protein
MRECARTCVMGNKACKSSDCRMWIDYKDDLNCTLITVGKSKDSMTLDEVSKRLNLSIVRVKQIQDKAVEKLRKNTPLLK